MVQKEAARGPEWAFSPRREQGAVHPGFLQHHLRLALWFSINPDFTVESLREV